MTFSVNKSAILSNVKGISKEIEASNVEDITFEEIKKLVHK